MPRGADLERVRNELDTARLHLDAAVGALDAWASGAAYPNEDILVRSLDGAEHAVRHAQTRIVRLIDRTRRGGFGVLGSPQNRAIFERWRQRLAEEQGG